MYNQGVPREKGRAFHVRITTHTRCEADLFHFAFVALRRSRIRCGMAKVRLPQAAVEFATAGIKALR